MIFATPTNRAPMPSSYVSCVLTLVALMASVPVLSAEPTSNELNEELRSRIEDLESALAQRRFHIDRMDADLRILLQLTDASDLRQAQDREKRLDSVEDALQDLDENIGSRALVNAFDGMSLDLGGFLHSTLTLANGEDGSEVSFNRQVFELLLRADLNEDWSAFVATAFFHQSDPQFDDNGDGLPQPGDRLDPTFNITSNSPLVLGWTNFRHSDGLNVRFGRFVAPHGIINIEHFPAILLDAEQPQFLRPFGGQTIFPNFVNGLSVHGKSFKQDTNAELSYNTYLANFIGNPNDFIAGGRVAYSWLDSGLTLGANLASGARKSDVSSDYEMAGIDFLIEQPSWQLKSELFGTFEDLGDDRLGYYVQPAWRLDSRWTVFYRHDFLDNGQGLGDRTENALGVNYRPLSNVVLRGTYTDRTIDETGDLESADAQLWQLSATVSF